MISTERPNPREGDVGAGGRRWQPWRDLGAALRNRRLRRDMVAGLAFLAPSLVVLVVFVYFPIVWSFGISFTNWQAGTSVTEFVGVQNYATTLTAGEFWNALRNTVYFMLLKLPIDIVLSLAVALLLNQ